LVNPVYARSDVKSSGLLKYGGAPVSGDTVQQNVLEKLDTRAMTQAGIRLLLDLPLPPVEQRLSVCVRTTFRCCWWHMLGRISPGGASR
jgi:hypothetical protein